MEMKQVGTGKKTGEENIPQISAGWRRGADMSERFTQLVLEDAVGNIDLQLPCDTKYSGGGILSSGEEVA